MMGNSVQSRDINRINGIKKVSKNLPKNYSETVTNEHDKEIL